jgi:O-antigen ligase
VTTRLESITSSFSFFDPSTVIITNQNFAVVERMAQLWAGWQMFLAHPLTGVGPGSYTLAYPAVASSPWFASRGHAHNYYIHIAAEAGIIGLIAYLALLSSVLGDLWRALQRSRGRMRRGVLIGVGGMIAALIGHNLFEHLHVLHLSIQSAAAWGMAAALAQTTEEI